MQIFIKDPGGETLAVSVDENTTVNDVVGIVAERTGLDSEDFWLSFGGKPMDNTLEEIKTTKDANLDVVLRMKGGFGAGNIPSHSFYENKAFRHGDIEDTLSELVKKSSGLFGRGAKFGGLDIKRIYFGNWLRDYSQAMDVAALSKLDKQTILNVVMGLGFLANGYATGEFEVTDERLGVYLCTEHIDNPKGYAADQPNGDARKFDKRLRGPVRDVELEVDFQTGMKNYIANERGNWDTSTGLIKERVAQCIEKGRRGRKKGDDADVYEAYRLLGTLLHTLEDFPAHSNWCELSLNRLGFSQVFTHVGDNVRIQTPAGLAPPIVTGTFGGSDFMHSLLGEATDKLSEASVSDLQRAMNSARGGSSRSIGGGGNSDQELENLLGQVPGNNGFSRDINNLRNIRARADNGQQLSPQELHATMWQVLLFRDNVMKGIENTIEKIPGLSALVEKISLSVNKFVFTVLEPLLKPILGSTSTILQTGSAQVINNAEQYEVFDNPNASDPTHSYLSKDHFNLILNEPAGLIACVILKHTVKAIVEAWEDDNIDPRQVGEKVCEAIHHPYFYNNRSAVQQEMGATLKSWMDAQDDKNYVLNALTKDSVRNHKNKRKGAPDDGSTGCHGGSSNNNALAGQAQNFLTQNVPGLGTAINALNQGSNAVNNSSFLNRDMQGGSGPGFYRQGYQERQQSSYNQSYGGGGYQQPQPQNYGYQPQSQNYGGYQSPPSSGGFPGGGFPGSRFPQPGGSGGAPHGHDGNPGYPGHHQQSSSGGFPSTGPQWQGY